MSQNRKIELASKINFLNLYRMNRDRHKFLVVILAVLSVTATATSIADEFLPAYSTSFKQNKNLPHVFKLTDSKGKISYSSSRPNEFIQAEKITIAMPPSDDYIEDTRQRHDKLKLAAVELGEAREKRKAIREEKETKRLQRLALINQSRPPVIYQRNIYSAYPYRLRKTHLHGGHQKNRKPVHLPANTYRSSRLALPSSSFSPMFHR
jgi:hypothetical protein